MDNELQNAAAAMFLASRDYDDNAGSDRARELWAIFEEKRREYLKLLKESKEQS